MLARRSPSALEELAGNVRAYLAKNPKQTLPEIAAGMGLNKEELKKPIQKLREANVINMRGLRRAARYSVKPR